MNSNIKNYLDSFGEVGNLKRKRFLDELDSVWDELGLNNVFYSVFKTGKPIIHSPTIFSIKLDEMN